MFLVASPSPDSPFAPTTHALNTPLGVLLFLTKPLTPVTPRWATMLVVLLAQSAGLLIGATVSNIKNCLAIASVTMLTLMLVGKFFVLICTYTIFNICH